MRPSGDHTGCAASAKASLMHCAGPPQTGTRQSKPSKSSRRLWPSGEGATVKLVPSDITSPLNCGRSAKTFASDRGIEIMVAANALVVSKFRRDSEGVGRRSPLPFELEDGSSLILFHPPSCLYLARVWKTSIEMRYNKCHFVFVVL